jgi:hypothetical protein
MTLARTTIDFATALRILVSIVQDFGPLHSAGEGDSGCTYFLKDSKANLYGGFDTVIDVHNLRPVCIVGQVFSRLGIMRALLTSTGDQYSTCQVGSDIWINADEMGVTFSEQAQTLLRAAQYNQDSGKTWREAVTIAAEEAKAQALEEFQKSDPSQRGVDDALRDLPSEPEPLAEWEKELLNG